MEKINLQGSWQFCLDKEKKGVEQGYFRQDFQEKIDLPATVATAKKGKPSSEAHVGYLTDPYAFEGYTWYSKDIALADVGNQEFFLVLERTRVSHIWINDTYVGSHNSLCTAHRYQITPYISKQFRITVMIDNTSYPVKGGHMTSPDTQTNWNGITGEICIEAYNKVYLTDIQIYPNRKEQVIEVKAALNGGDEGSIKANMLFNEHQYSVKEYRLVRGVNTFTYPLDSSMEAWSEHTPAIYQLSIELQGDKYLVPFGIRDFKAGKKYFEVNETRTFLRGKHDGLIFPLTGHAPTDLDSWLKILRTAKEYGINHYRFHTCCPPRAAFTAADILGIYLEPELPFWGTITVEGEENHDEAGQQYLIEEGFRILNEFGNHPSFVMFSLGNELWGSKERLDSILAGYRDYDTRHLYTQGSNNFQFMPCILENEDFFCGVRFSRERLFRGSYAMCDAPQGHIQTAAPNMNHNYDEIIRPSALQDEEVSGGDVTIQYGTGTKTVKMDTSEAFIPNMPVVSHEVGQYAMYPDFNEIEKYTGVLKARNFEIMKERLRAKEMLPMAEHFFKASGRFAAECYKAEIEAALRSNELAGFQLLDLQDFSGQGTALVGVLDAFMESKGVVSSEEWRTFCSDKVLLAELPKHVFTASEKITFGIKIATFSPDPMSDLTVELAIYEEDKVIYSTKNENSGLFVNGVYTLAPFELTFPAVQEPKQLMLQVALTGSEVKNQYDIWVYPAVSKEIANNHIVITKNLASTIEALEAGGSVLFYPENLNESNSIEGTYCTDFWCYPMFRSISESMGRAVPIGTHGLLIDKQHQIFEAFPTEQYSTPQWYDFVSNGRALILDNTSLEPIVWSIDNFERNHRLGNIIEVTVGTGKLLICTVNLQNHQESQPIKWLEKSILSYMNSDLFNPTQSIEKNELEALFTSK